MTERQIPMPSQRLFELNIPQGWNVTKDHRSGRILASEEPPFGLSWEDLNEEMIFVTSSRCSLAIDLGWYPDYAPDGQFCIEVVDLGVIKSVGHFLGGVTQVCQPDRFTKCAILALVLLRDLYI